MGWEAMTPEDRSAWFSEMNQKYGSGIVQAATGTNDFLRDILEGDPDAIADAVEGKVSQVERFHPEDVKPAVRARIEKADVKARARVAGVFDKLGRNVPPMFVAGASPGGGEPENTAQWFDGSDAVVYYDLSKTAWGKARWEDGSPGSALAATNEVDVLTHEYGHAYFDYMPSEKQGEWSRLFHEADAQQKDRWEQYQKWQGDPHKFQRELEGETPVPCPTDRSPSYYAAENFNEAFGEIFLLVQRGGYNTEDYDPEWQRLIGWMEQELGR